MVTVTVGNEELGNVLYDRSDPETPRTLGFQLARASRIVESIPAGGVTLPPRLKVHGRDNADFVIRTERNFESQSEAILWVLDLALVAGFTGPVKFEVAEGGQRVFDYGIAEPSGTQIIGAMVLSNWRIRTGRERDS